MGLVIRWAAIIAERNKKEMVSNKVYSYFEDDLFYKSFLKECEKSGLSTEQAEDIWYTANKTANEIE